MLLRSIPGSFLWATYDATVSVLRVKKTFLNYFLLLQHKNTEEAPQDPSHIQYSIPNIPQLLAPGCICVSQPIPPPARYYKILIPWDSREGRYSGTLKFLSIAGPRPRKCLCQTFTTNSFWNICRPTWLAKWTQTWKNLWQSESCSTWGVIILNNALLKGGFLHPKNEGKTAPRGAQTVEPLQICSLLPEIIWNHAYAVSARSQEPESNPNLLPTIFKQQQQNLDPDNYHWVWFRGKKVNTLQIAICCNFQLR